jgi:hypothetical protein
MPTDDISNTLGKAETVASSPSEREEARDGDSLRGAPVSEIERKLLSAAEELGTWLGTAERKTTEFLAQQPTIADHLVRIRDTATKLLAQIEKGRERSR